MLSYNSGGFWVSEYRHRGKSTETEQKLSEREKHHKEKENIKQSPMKKKKKKHCKFHHRSSKNTNIYLA